MATTYNETRVNLSGVIKFQEDGKTPVTDLKTGEIVTSTDENLVEKKANEIIAAQKATGQAEPEASKIQTFQYTEIGGATLDEVVADFKALIEKYQQDAGNQAKVAASIVNRGVVLAQQKSLREFMLDAEQPAVEGVYDLMTDAVVPGEGRRKADPRTQAAKALTALLGRTVSVDEVNTLLASFQTPAAV